MPNPGKSRDSRIIKTAPPTTLHQRNPYRTILRRDYPEPFIALLVFILGIWLWDHYFGTSGGYAPGTEEVALVKIDRDLRMADAMSDDPVWLRWLAGVDQPATAREDALAALSLLAAENAMSLHGLEAFAILKAVHEGLPLRETLATMLQDQTASDFAETSRQLAAYRGSWWQAKWVAAMEADVPPVCEWRNSQVIESSRLRMRAIALRSGVWLLGLAGVVFIPHTLRELKRGLGSKPRGYGGSWPLALGLVVFLLATLAWIGFTMTLEMGISALPGLHPLAAILLDAAARLLPAMIALGFLFRRPSHAVRVLGLDRPPALRTIFGVFSLLAIIDPVLRLLTGGGDAEPGGGLSPGEAGLWGLAFTMISACLLAPFAEEVLYRGVLFRAAWNRIGVLPAAFLSAALFAVLHFYDGYGLATVGIFGMACALLYAATGSLVSCIALHMLYNAIIKIPEWIIYHGSLG